MLFGAALNFLITASFEQVSCSFARISVASLCVVSSIAEGHWASGVPCSAAVNIMRFKGFSMNKSIPAAREPS